MPRPILNAKRRLKKLPELIQEAHTAHPQARIQVWAFDEHRIGLKPILRRVWARRGHRPPVVVPPRYQWRYLYGFVEPATGQTQWWLFPTVRTDILSLVLRDFATAVGAGPDTHLLLVLDGAGGHTSRALQVPEGIDLVFLPPSSPELPPAEHLWPLTNEALVNQHFTTLDALEDRQGQDCVQLQSQIETLRSLTRFHWWPASTA